MVQLLWLNKFKFPHMIHMSVTVACFKLCHSHVNRSSGLMRMRNVFMCATTCLGFPSMNVKSTVG